MNPYQYNPVKQNQIRLLRIEMHDDLVCSMKAANLKDGSEYAALSYTWDNLVQDDPLTCDG
jgi:hypothetical protein